MRSKQSEWFEVKVRYDKMNEEGIPKAITEQYVVDAFTFTETESILKFITIDEKTEKEKSKFTTYLVQASTLQQAVKNVEEIMGKTMEDYQIASISETKILDVFEHNAKPLAEQKKDDKPEYEE